jgi:phenylalanyl-tRNA synthetase beta chain
MKFTLSWLKDWLETDADPATIADTLTNIGLEVEEVSNPAEALAPFRVAKVLTAEKHPQADKLQVLTVDAGTGEKIQVVCGAPNARAGMLGVFGAPGAYIPGSDMTLKIAAIRGVESRGMMCSARELQLGEDHAGIIELPDDAPVGIAFADYAGLNDPVFDVNVTPNRPDCFGINGIARDLAAVGLGHSTDRANYEVVEGRFPCPVPIRIEEGSGCRVFWGRVIRGVRNGPSPDWLQRRLKAVGLRPISALVDITNFFTMDRARPLHVYDLAKLEGGIVARRGRKGDAFLALNEKEYEATRDDCVIADDSGAIGFGGVIGGESTGVDENTTDVLLECAWFEPEAVAATGRRHGIISDARTRFERGVDTASLSSGIEYATAMILELCGGEPSEPRIATDHVDESFFSLPMKPYRPSRLKTLGGIELDPDSQRAILVRLGFVDMDLSDPERWQVRPPSWRPDIDGEADLVEEVARIHGYDKVPATPFPRASGVAKPTATRSQLVERQVRRTAAARGLDEAVTWSFISDVEAGEFGGSKWRLANPISEEMKRMRPSLLPGLIAAARRNLDRGASSARLFEVGRRYLGDAEHPTLSLLLAGEKRSRGWQSGKATPFVAFDAMAEALALLDAAGAPTDNLQVFPDAGPTWHPGRSATLRLGPKTIVASFGELHPRLQKSLDAPAGAVAAEIYLDAIPAGRSSGHARSAYAPPGLQAITRDFAFVVPADLSAADLVRAIRGADKAAITAARVFDRFEKNDELSLAVEVTLQPQNKSFTDEQIGEISKRIVAAAEKLGAQLRG